MNLPKITVVIPTRERCDVLQRSLRTVTSQDYDNLEIIVSDNYSCDGTEEAVRAIQDSRVKYVNTGKRLSMSHNWEFAISHVADGWVTVIGDDDALLQNALTSVAEIIKSTGTQAIRARVCEYVWPSLTGTGFGTLSIPLTTGYEVRDSKLWLGKVMSGVARYPELPMLYNGGFICTALLTEIKRRTGALYKSLTPDVYSALSIASVVERYVHSSEPLAINGASKYSTGTSSFSKGEKSDGAPTEVFRSEENIPFHKDLPLCVDSSYPPSIHAIIYESYLQSAGLRPEALQNINTQQLEIILATSGQHKREVDDWGKIFAATHGLDFEEIHFKAMMRWLYIKLALFPRRVSAALNTYYAVGSESLPIADVCEAVAVVTDIRGARPSKFITGRQLLGRVIVGSSRI